MGKIPPGSTPGLGFRIELVQSLLEPQALPGMDSAYRSAPEGKFVVACRRVATDSKKPCGNCVHSGLFRRMTLSGQLNEESKYKAPAEIRIS